MTTRVYDVEFITPAFLSGANQNRAELRAPSIRGQLRWWYRVLGGNYESESAVFGGVKGTARASKIILRITSINARHEDLPHMPPMSDLGYIYYFAKASGNKEGVRRTQRDAFFAPETKFRVEVLERSPLASGERETLDMALKATWRLGALGLRATRGCGALTESNAIMAYSDFIDWVKVLPDSVFVGQITTGRFFDKWLDCHAALGGFLKNFRKDNKLPGHAESALGFSAGSRKRAASALIIRPVKLKEGYLPLLIYTDAATTQPSIIEKLKKYRVYHHALT